MADNGPQPAKGIEDSRKDSIMRFTAAEARRLGVLPKTKRTKAGTEAAKLKKEAEQDAFRVACMKAGLPCPRFEFRFHATRKWRLDFVFRVPNVFGRGVALEKNGGIWTKGRHVQPKALEDEYLKFTEAQIAGFTVILVSAKQFNDVGVFELIRRALEA